MTINLQKDYSADKGANPHAFVQQSLSFPITLDLNTLIDERDPVRTVIMAVEESGIYRYVSTKGRDSHGYRSIDMLKAVILSKTLLGYAGLREMEDIARNDIRFRLIFNDGKTPSHESFHRFITKNLTVSVDTVMSKLNRYMASKLPEDIDTDTEVIDGTKEEADANKMSFVWRGSSEKYQGRLYRKVYELLTEIITFFNSEGCEHQLSILRRFDLCYMVEVCRELEKYIEKKKIVFVYGKGKRKTDLQRWYEKAEEYAISLWKYEMHFDILGERNSFSKSDPDATFMHMKYDYYNHTNVFKPGYNVQIGSCSGFIWDIYISSDSNDMKTFIPLLEQHRKNYGSYPLRTPADAGYGSYDNYQFCKDNGIELFMKYPGYEAEMKRVTDKNRFKAIHFSEDENGLPVCPAGHAFRIEKTRTENRGVYKREMETLVNDHCLGCPLRSKCTKSKSGVRRIQRCVKLNEWKNEARSNLETDLGKDVMTLRRVYGEGIFGDKKYNWNYDKMRRIGETGVKTEIYMYALGKNMRRFHLLYWKRKDEEQAKVEKLMKFVNQHRPAQA